MVLKKCDMEFATDEHGSAQIRKTVEGFAGFFCFIRVYP